MSGREWKPGDVAMLRLCSESEVRVMYTGSVWFGYKSAFYDPSLPTRPLVVIDPEDREQVKRLADIGTRIADPRRTGLASDHAIRSLQAALREFANPQPPKPDEPQGLGAVVEDAEGKRWVRDEGVSDRSNVWYRHGEGASRRYDAIDAVRVLNEGVQP